MKKYEIIDHTADIGLRAKGEDLKRLFINAAYGMFDIMADLGNVKTKKTIAVNLKAPNIEELFLSWLSELLFYYNSKKIIFNAFSVEDISEGELHASAAGEDLDIKRHDTRKEIKAVTFHQLKVESIKGIWQAEVIFDV